MTFHTPPPSCHHEAPDLPAAPRPQHLTGDVRWRASLIDGCVDAIVSVTSDGTVVTWNAAAEQLYGYPASDMVGYSVGRLFVPAQPDHLDPLAFITAGDPMASTDVLCTRRDGRQIEVALTLSPVRTDEGTLAGATVIGRDVTTTREAERRLREGEIHLRSVVDTAADGIIAITSRGIIESVNPAAERLFGYRAEELVGNNVRMLMPAPFCHEHDRYLENFDRTGVPKVIGIGREVVGRRKDGQTFPMELAVSVMRVGEAQKFTGIVRDITERKQAEEALRNREAQIRSIVETAVDGIIVIDAKGVVEAYNPAAERLFGYRADEVIGQNVKLLMPEPYRANHDGFIAAFLSTGERRVIGIGREVVGMRKDGSTFPMELAVSEMRIGDRRKFTGLVRDITERKRVEESMTAYLSEVEESRDRMQQQAQQMALQTEELADARDAAEAAMRAKGDFLAVMSHEIRTPMNGLLGMAELLRTTPLDADQQQCVDTIVRSGEALLTIINDVLDFSKLEAGRLEIEQLPYDMRGLLEDVGELFAAVASRRGIELVLDVDPRLAERAVGDPTRMRQIVTNLVSNAIKFTERGHVLVRLDRHEREDGDEVELSVADTGVGIADEDLPRLFRSFSQAQASTARKYGGTGLGLAISRRLVEAMGGTISATSVRGAGTTFTVVLPYRPIDEPPTAAGPMLVGRRLLVLDTNGASSRALGRVLSAAGAAWDESSDAAQALALVEEAALAGQPYDLAVIDAGTGESAATLCTALLSDGAGQTPIVLTATNALACRDELAALGASAVIAKPLRARRLREAIARALHLTADEASGDLADRVSRGTAAIAPPVVVHGIGRRRILAADDNEVNRLVLRRMLERLGHDCEVTDDGIPAVQLFESACWDLVLMDCNMPGLDGFRAAEAMRAHEARGTGPRTPIVAVTASILPSDMEHCTRAGMDGCLLKPIVMAQLQAAITDALRAAGRV